MPTATKGDVQEAMTSRLLRNLQNCSQEEMKSNAYKMNYPGKDGTKGALGRGTRYAEF